MSFPKFPQKYTHPSVFTAHDLAARIPGLEDFQMPERMILCFQGHVLKHLVKTRRGKKLSVTPPFGELYSLRAARRPVGVIGNFGIGAPLAVFMLEWLAALGARQFLVIGIAGGLLEDQSAGDLVLSSKALRDEGTSYHYLPPADFVEPDQQLAEQLNSSLNYFGYTHNIGPTWTIDAPLRETLPEIEHHRRLGILTVDMEAAGLFAASDYLGLACAAAFCVADAPKNGRWQLDYDRRALQNGLERLADAAVHALETFQA